MPISISSSAISKTSLTQRLLISFASDAHEKAFDAVLRIETPQLHASPLPDIHPKISQCECFSAADINAHLQPEFDMCATHLEAALNVIVLCAVKGAIQSKRGLISLEYGHSHPVRTVMSGPAAEPRPRHSNSLRFSEVSRLLQGCRNPRCTYSGSCRDPAIEIRGRHFKSNFGNSPWRKSCLNL